MVRKFASLALFVLALGWGRTAVAQEVAPAPPVPGPPSLVDRLKTPDQGGGLHVTKHFAVVFGDIKAGSGIALGPAFSHAFEDGGYTQIKAVYSVRQFRLLQARYDSRKLWQGRVTATTRLRWQVAPELPLFLIGPRGPAQTVDYGERKTEGSARLAIQLSPRLRVASGFGLERYAVTAGRIDPTDDESLPAVPAVPGLGVRAWYAHTFLSGAIDSRGGDYTRRGRLIEAGIHDYRDMKGGRTSFERVEGTVQQVVPALARGAIDLSARTWLSLSSGSRPVPFFLMPTLCDTNCLAAFKLYRFRDRNALLLKGEYRWAVHEMVDVAGVYELGKVAPDVRGLSLHHAASSLGAGLRIHTATANLMSLDLAHGREGFGFVIGFSAGSP